MSGSGGGGLYWLERDNNVQAVEMNGTATPSPRERESVRQAVSWTLSTSIVTLAIVGARRLSESYKSRQAISSCYLDVEQWGDVY